MKTSIEDKIAVLDRETEKLIAEAGEHIFSRLGERIAALNLRFDEASQAGSTTCEVVVQSANRVQILARHQDRDALKAALTALERARVQVRRVLRKPRTVPSRDLALTAS